MSSLQLCRGLPRFRPGFVSRFSLTIPTARQFTHPTHLIHANNTPTDSEPPQNEILQLSLRLARAPLNHRATLSATEYFPRDTDRAPVRRELAKLDLVADYGVQARDLRDLDLPSDANPHVLVRPETVLVDFFDLRLLIQAGRVLVVDTAGGGKSSPKAVFLEQIKKITENTDNTTTNNNTKAAFEFLVLESSLVAVTVSLEAEFLLTRRLVETHLASLSLAAVETRHADLDILLRQTESLAEIEHRARLVRAAIQEILDSDEDLAATYLTDAVVRGKPHAVADHQEAEYLFETYLKTTHGVVESASSLLRRIRRTEATVGALLDVKRNQIMYLDVRLSVLAAGVALGTFVAGLYGMNLVNYLEESPVGFVVMSTGCVLLGLVVVWAGGRRIKGIQRIHK
ncbi:hypothetical protein ASPZODRAFT_674999 [Penicilliopsis zonata CBS 506.65]|uniref:Magnesium transporter n=1 Tax=Penicilliopsis zonata CBS 506.65 TaxID=1073090 RepID=A0A1L9SD61_9EURO|nr:hypothetical protein ASPZODRAFT_674999 [Penicilliopsis zonata CBS 506.65]OJJ45078.1 hypothetical protein ASPZODRAFT_674999 [Penicilliopsis zonata CBS 506.65]